MYRVTALSRAALVACLAASFFFLSNPSAQAHGPDRSWTGYDPGFGPVDIFNGNPARTIDANGWLGGGQIGFNYQTGSLVFGVEVDGSWSNIDGDETFALDTDNNKSTDYTWRIKSRLDRFGTVRGRVGIAHNNLLFYGTAGLALGRTNSDLTVTGFPPQGFNPPQVTAVGSATENHIGWTVGGGLEWMFARNWSMKAEYLYVDLGGADYRLKGTAYPGTAPCAGPPAVGCSFPHTTDSFPADLTFHTIRVGVNYKFGQ